jgi:hypothetical protein
MEYSAIPPVIPPDIAEPNRPIWRTEPIFDEASKPIKDQTWLTTDKNWGTIFLYSHVIPCNMNPNPVLNGVRFTRSALNWYDKRNDSKILKFT